VADFATRCIYGDVILDAGQNEERSAIGDSVCGLIRQTRNGAVDAREQLLTQLRSYVALVAGNRTTPGLQAKLGNSDLVQESMAIAVEKFDQFEGSSEAELFAWVKTILENEVRQAKRAFRSEKRDIFRERSLDQQRSGHLSSTNLPLEIPDKDLTPRTVALQNENQDQIQRAIQNLNDEYRLVIELRNWNGLSFAEIGERMNRTENAATKLWYRALIALRKTMEQNCD